MPANPFSSASVGASNANSPVFYKREGTRRSRSWRASTRHRRERTGDRVAVRRALTHKALQVRPGVRLATQYVPAVQVLLPLPGSRPHQPFIVWARSQLSADDENRVGQGA